MIGNLFIHIRVQAISAIQKPDSTFRKLISKTDFFLYLYFANATNILNRVPEAYRLNPRIISKKNRKKNKILSCLIFKDQTIQPHGHGC